MIPKNYEQKLWRHRLLIFLFTTVFFVCGFVLNIVMNEPLYNTNLNVVPKIQKSQGWGSSAFLVFMNIVSNVFNPIVCAGYIIVFFIISYRKLEILVFLIWFIFLSWILSLFKMIFHQARPYWISGSGVQMLEWTCYTQFGMPSGHSMMAIILLEFVVRFYARVNKFVARYIAIFYVLVIAFEVLVMFSRVILGMHSFNQVLFGCMLGCYTFVPYYLYAERFILRWVLSIFRQRKSIMTTSILICISFVSFCTQILISQLLKYNNNDYITVIQSIKGCDGFLVFKSFQYKCLEDSALLMAGVGILFAFNFMKNPSHLYLQLDYTRFSFRFLKKILLTLLIPVIIVAAFLNPLWNKVNLGDDSKALMIWGLQIVGFFFSTFVLIYLIPIINNCFKLQAYKVPESYEQFKKFEVINMIQSNSFIVRTELERRETELIKKQSTLGQAKTEKIEISNNSIE